MKRILCIVLLAIVVLAGCSAESSTTITLSTEELQEMEDERMENRLLVGIWEGPRKYAMATKEDAIARYEEIKEAGINAVFLYSELTDEEWLELSLYAAETTGVSLIIDLGGVYTNKNAFYKVLEKTKDSKAVIGYNIVDEPSYEKFVQIKKIADILKEEVGNDKLIFCNLLPSYGSENSFASAPAEGMTMYQTYLDNFCSSVQGNLLHVDYYPYHSSKSSDTQQITNMVACLLDMRNTAEKHNIPWGGFLQSSRWGKYLDDGTWSGTRIPNEVEYRFITHLHLCFGAKTVSNFLYWSRNGSDPAQRVSGIFDGLITYEGEKTPVYDIVKNTNQAVHAMKGVYLSYEHKGFMTCGLSEEVNMILKDQRFKSFGVVEKASGDGQAIIGCFEDGERSGLYVLNYKITGEDMDSITIYLNECCEYQVWGADGLEQAGESEQVKVSLLPGEGCFIELNKK